MIKFYPRFRRIELPVDGNTPAVTLAFPNCDLRTHEIYIRDSSFEALRIQRTQLNLGDIEPTAVFRRIVYLQAFS